MYCNSCRIESWGYLQRGRSCVWVPHSSNKNKSTTLDRECTDTRYRYPPDRQTIYLDVARPRGLIIIEKASKEEGRLSDQVRGWIKENLELRAEVPGLELLDDGTVVGGSLDEDGQDVLLHQQSLKSKYPGVIVGPDSTPTLSFTSGSEGRPKGVQGYEYLGFSLSCFVSDLERQDIVLEQTPPPIPKTLFINAGSMPRINNTDPKCA